MTSNACSEYDVAVLGGGLSGLYATRELLLRAPGLRVVVLEARDRVGGRTHSIPFNGDAYDVGGQWVGPTQTLTLALIQQLGLTRKRQPWWPAPSHPNPEGPSHSAETSPEESLAASAAAVTIGAKKPQAAVANESLSSGCAIPLSREEAAEVDDVTKTLDELAASAEMEGPEWGAAAREWDAVDCKTQLKAMCRSPGALREMLLFVQTVLAADPCQPSFLFLLKYIRAAGGLRALGDGDGGAQQWRLAGGAQQMAAGLAAAVAGAGGGEVRLSHIVESVAHSASNAAAAQNHTGCGSGEPGVYTVAGTVEGSGEPFSLTARRVVVAMPPPVWKRIAFDPPLPEGHRLLAETMVMGCVAKVLAIYPQRFWALEGEEADSSTGGGAAGADDEVVRDAPHRPPRRARGGAGGRRLEEFGPVANLFPGDYGGRPALVGLVTGADARAFTALPEGRQRAAVLGQYAEYFGAPEAAEPELFVVKEWMSERFSGGCFGGLTPPGLLSRAGAAAAGRAAGGVHFAGSEAAARWVGYFEGALDAGLRAALDVLAALRPGLVGSAATSGGDGEGPAAAL